MSEPHDERWPDLRPISDFGLYTTIGAVDYLNQIGYEISKSGIRWHLYQSHSLAPDCKVGRSILFTQETLDEFAKSQGANES